jgi:hypothetical protein
MGELIHLTGEEARQGEIVLKHRSARGIFLGGLIGSVILAAAIALFG